MATKGREQTQTVWQLASDVGCAFQCPYAALPVLAQTPGRPELQKKRQHSSVGAAPKVSAASSVRNKDVETAAGNHGRDIPAAKSQAAVSREHRVLQHAWLIVIRVNRAGRQVIGRHRVVRRERSGDDFINADACAGQRAIQPLNKSGAVRHVGSIEQSGLLHGPAQISNADNFKHVAQAASEFLFGIGAAASESAGHRNSGEEGKYVTHKIFGFLWFLDGNLAVSGRVVKRELNGFFLAALPIPGNPEADFVERLQGDEHNELCDDFRCGQQRAKNKVDDNHVLSALGEDAVIENSDLYHGQDDHRHLKAQPHAKHEFADETDIVIGFPLVGPKTKPLGIFLGGGQGNGHQQNITKRDTEHEKAYPET